MNASKSIDKLPLIIAKHFKGVYFGGNWTAVHLKQVLSDVDWQLATRESEDHHSILALTYHIHYFVLAIKGVLVGNSLEAKDKFSFDHPPISTEADWNNFLEMVWQTGLELIDSIEQLPEDRLFTYFVAEKYGSYYDNLTGMIEHCHYHLGQIVMIKKEFSE